MGLIVQMSANESKLPKKKKKGNKTVQVQSSNFKIHFVVIRYGGYSVENYQPYLFKEFEIHDCKFVDANKDLITYYNIVCFV